MIISISTVDYKTVKVALLDEGVTIDEMVGTNAFGSQEILPLVVKLLEKHRIEFKQLKEVKVATGPGSYTGLRVGVSVANAIGYALNIPVNGKEMETDLVYD